MASVAYEVFARYLFNAPTIWSFDVTYMLYGALFMLGAAYALHKGAHIRTDFFWDNFSPRTKGLIDTISYIVFFFPSFTDARWSSAGTRPNTPSRSMRPPTRHPGGRSCGPSRAVVPAACLLLLIQGFSELLKSFYMARTGIELEHKEKVEV